MNPETNLPSSNIPKGVGGLDVRGQIIRMNVRAASALVMAKDTGRLLLAFRSTSALGHIKEQKWNLWGGKVDLEESPEMSAVKWTKRQTSYTGHFTDSIPLYTFFSTTTNFRYYIFLLVVEKEFTPTIEEGGSILNYKWVEYGEWPELLHPIVKELFIKVSSKLKGIIEKIIIKESLAKEYITIKLKELIKELWQ
jgi:ADP-ribose pyrophosphatase YjhB (NUDIX family)